MRKVLVDDWHITKVGVWDAKDSCVWDFDGMSIPRLVIESGDDPVETIKARIAKIEKEIDGHYLNPGYINGLRFALAAIDGEG